MSKIDINNLTVKEKEEIIKQLKYQNKLLKKWLQLYGDKTYEQLMEEKVFNEVETQPYKVTPNEFGGFAWEDMKGKYVKFVNAHGHVAKYYSNDESASCYQRSDCYLILCPKKIDEQNGEV